MVIGYGDSRSPLRLTGKAFFLDSNPVTAGQGYIHLGNIRGYKLDPKIERKDIMRNEGGVKVRARQDVLSVLPEYEIEGDEIFANNAPLIFMGTQQSSVVQTSGSGTVTIAAAKAGNWYPIGKVDVTVSGVTEGGSPKSAVEWVVDGKKGLICFLTVTTGPIVVSYANVAKTRTKFTFFDTPQRAGTMIIYGIDGPENTVDPNHTLTFACDLISDPSGEFKPDDPYSFKIMALLRGPMEALFRQDS